MPCQRSCILAFCDGSRKKKAVTGSSEFKKYTSVLAPESPSRISHQKRREKVDKDDDMCIVICMMHSDFQLIESFDYSLVLPRRTTNDHCSVDTPLLVTYVQGTLQGACATGSHRSFLSFNSTFLGF
jgi:hypothetical protein